MGNFPYRGVIQHNISFDMLAFAQNHAAEQGKP